MFIGHFGLGLAAKRVDPRPSLGTLIMASQFVDLLWSFFLLFGIETVKIEPGNTAFTPLNLIYYPFSHSLFSVIILGLLFGGFYFMIRGNVKGALILGSLVVSHWILDFITHRPDLPLIPWNGIKTGLGLWDSVFLTILLEGSIFICGAYLYLKYTRAKNSKGKWGIWGLLVLLGIIYVSNIIGPPPPAVEPIAYVGMLQWIFVIWGYRIDKNRAKILND